MHFINDSDVWSQCPIDYLWIYDKLILARKLGHLAAPAGIAVPHAANYVVRPITNIRMMSRGAQIMWLEPKDTDLVPDGFFWSQCFQGRHITVDYHWGLQHLAAEGFRLDPLRLDRFSSWQRIPDQFTWPAVLGTLGQQVPWVNIEMVDNHIIEVHLRWNDDFTNHTSNVIYPQWSDEPIVQPPNTTWYASAAGDRLGFWLQH